MTDGLVLPPGAGQAISGAGMILKVGDGQSPVWSVFEATVGPGFDVGAHLHRQAEELFYILEGELDLLAFEPGRANGRQLDRLGVALRRPGGPWRPGKRHVCPGRLPACVHQPRVRAGPDSFHGHPARPRDLHAELGALVARPGPPDPAAIAALRARHDIQQLTPMAPGRGN